MRWGPSQTWGIIQNTNSGDWQIRSNTLQALNRTGLCYSCSSSLNYWVTSQCSVSSLHYTRTTIKFKILTCTLSWSVSRWCQSVSLFLSSLIFFIRWAELRVIVGRDSNGPRWVATSRTVPNKLVNWLHSHLLSQHGLFNDEKRLRV